MTENQCGYLFKTDDITTPFHQEMALAWKENKGLFTDRFKALHQGSNALYNGYPIPSLPWLLPLSQEKVFSIKVHLEAFMAFLEVLTERIIAQAPLRRHYLFTEERWEFIEKEAPYGLNIPIARMDAYLGDEGMQILEINTDGSSGMSNVDCITDNFLSTPGAKLLRKKWNIEPFELVEKLGNLLLEIKDKTYLSKNDPINIAIVDWSGAGTRAEFKEIANRFNKRQLSAHVYDPRNIDYQGGQLYCNGKAIDLIYRRLVSSEFFSRREDCTAFYQGLANNAAVLVGSFRSDIAFNKGTLALISDPAFDSFMPPGIDFIRKLIPWTRFLDESSTDFQNREISIPIFAMENKDLLVLKPCDLYGGKGVLVGAITDEKDWEYAVESALLTGGFIIQERVLPSQIILPPFDKKDMEVKGQNLDTIKNDGEKRYNMLLGPYLFGGKLSGFLCRLTPDLHLNDRSLEITLPVAQISPKKSDN